MIAAVADDPDERLGVTPDADLAALRAAYSGNVRPIQPRNGRPIAVGQVTTGGQ